MRGDMAERLAAWIATGDVPPRPASVRVPPPAPALPPALLAHVAAWVPEGAPQEPLAPVAYLTPQACRNCAQPVAFRTAGPRGEHVKTVDVLEGGAYSEGHRCAGLPKEVRFTPPPRSQTAPRPPEQDAPPYAGAPPPLRPVAVKGLRGAFRIE